MNFAIVDTLIGQKDGKGFQAGVPEMTATVRDINNAEYNKKGKHIQQITMQDSQGRVEKVKVYLGNGPVLMPTDVGTLQMFQQVAPNNFKGTMYYMAFWDNMHPPQGQSPTPEIQPTHLNAATQAIIDEARNRSPHLTRAQVIDQIAPLTPTDPSTKYPDQPTPTTQQDYQAKEREKVIGMCMTGHVNARLAVTPPTELLADKAQIAALWQIATMIVDGTGQAPTEVPF